ncbi:helix-turn-helix domain-containing protein [Allostreptomyces psammosilenae]|uniref:Transcriptional regulator with XRE-family HTH domain n=1 Tax=Allostreptomyces psammosilenae TaxID=1892865 RepID=A0A852ZY10_9ACTN|nr:helix-turn-helix domain-containing protein [Allostreptomyces psammosilenae]NYI07216.1 transcriptional regulator with XRE-family HTH domain [Allostreptomyces psammosilenae]
MESSPPRPGPPRPAPDVGTHEAGRRLRRLRQERGVSLSALARRAGVGKATLSGLENGTRNPTLETLQAVSAGLGVPLTALLTPPGTAGEPAPVMHGAAVEVTLLQVFDDATVTYELYRMRVAAGFTQVSQPHQRGVTEHVTVFAGLLRAGPADAPSVAGVGEHISWAADVPHTYQAVGPEDVVASLLMRYPREPAP